MPKLRACVLVPALLLAAACSSSAADGGDAARSPVAASSGSGGNAAAGAGAGGAGASGVTGAAAAGGAGASAAGSGESGAAASDAGDASSEAGDATVPAVVLPPINAGLDYQLGGAYPPPAGVQIVSRDRNAQIEPGLYNICYVNGFQIQPDEEAFWTADHPELILRDAAQNPVIDQDWNEMLIDVSTPDKRAAVAEIVGQWIAGCATAGFDAVEIDNLDSFSRSGGRLSEDDAVAAMHTFSEAAHAAGLAIAQKNSAELVARRAELGTDFVVAEECNRYAECDVYTGAYGEHVLVIEYRRADFDTGCAQFPGLSIVLRDVNLVAPGGAQYVYDGC